MLVPAGSVGATAVRVGASDTPPTVVPAVTTVAPASVRYFLAAAISASVVPVVPNGSTNVLGINPITLPSRAFGLSIVRQSAGILPAPYCVIGSAGSGPAAVSRASGGAVERAPRLRAECGGVEAQSRGGR